MENEKEIVSKEAKLSSGTAVDNKMHILTCDEIRKKESIKKEPEQAPDSDFELEEEKENKPRRAAKIFSIILHIVLFSVIIILILRICQADHKELTGLYITDELRAVYADSTDLRTHVAGTEFSENGAIYAYSFVYNEQNGYMQLTVRYNERHLDEVVDSLNENAENGEQYTLDDIEIFYLITDSNGITYTPRVLDDTSKYDYVYFKLELTGVDFKADNLSVHMMLDNIMQTKINGLQTLVYKEGESTNAGSELVFHEKSDTYIEYELSKDERAELE